MAKYFDRQRLSVRVGVFSLIFSLVIGPPGLGFAQVVTNNSGNTKVYNAPNGVPVVDIRTANSAGVSHNVYSQFNVDAKGLVLNNATSEQLMRQSQLAGQVAANLNLAAPAKIILNEVNVPNRSNLAGYVEVLGKSADVIIANPYGITCNGCGFINTPRVTLSTGKPNIGADGSLNGFSVNQGDLLINGAGLDAKEVSYLDLVARTIKVAGQINAQDLKIAVGSNTWDYAQQKVSGFAADTPAPLLGFDSTALGGMYANRIFIRATEAGVGVRMLGEAAALADDLTIDAQGKISLANKLSAERDLALRSNASDALALNNAQLSAKQNLSMTAATGNASMTGGTLTAGNNLTGVFASLTDNASNNNDVDNNKR